MRSRVDHDRRDDGLYWCLMLTALYLVLSGAPDWPTYLPRPLVTELFAPSDTPNDQSQHTT